MGAAKHMRTAVVALVVVAVAAMPFIVSDRYLLKVLTFVGVNVLVVVGLSLLFGYAGQISLGHAAFVGIGAYASGFLSKAGWPWPASAAAAVLLAAAGGAALALPSMRLKGHYLAMATLGFGEIMSVAFVELKSVTGGTDGLSGIPYASIGSFSFKTPAANFLLVWGAVGVALLLASNMVRLRPGRALRAMHASEAGAQACGVDIPRAKLQVFVVSSALAGLAGVLYAHYVGFISPSSFSLGFSIVLVAMVVLGGMKSLSGAVAGAVLLTLLTYIDAVLPGLPRPTVALIQDWQQDIYGLTLILVMLFMPKGLAGAGRSLTSALSRRRQGAFAEGGGESA